MNTHEPEASPTARERRQDARKRQIMDAALIIAQERGWAAVTTRRLAEAIDYSQPVLYQHFTNRDHLIRAIAMEGFGSLTQLIHSSTETTADPVEQACRAYLEFARTQPRVYEAMFSLPTAIRFDSPETPAVVRSSFDALKALLVGARDVVDAEAAAEFFWALCHGLATLMAAGRMPKERIDAHIAAAGRSLGAFQAETVTT